MEGRNIFQVSMDRPRAHIKWPKQVERQKVKTQSKHFIFTETNDSDQMVFIWSLLLIVDSGALHAIPKRLISDIYQQLYAEDLISEKALGK